MIRSKRNLLAALFGTAAVLPMMRFPTPAEVYEHLKGCWSWYEAREILSARPLRIQGVEACKEGGFTVLSNSRGDRLQLNPMAGRIWRLCDGRNTVEAMVRAITAEYAVAPGVCQRDVLLTLRRLRREGFISC